LDEAGQLKNKCSNRRASEFANLCGYEAVSFAGDVLIGRVEYTQLYGIRNINYNINDMDSNAKWLKGVYNRNYQQGIENQQINLKQNINENENYEKIHIENEKNGYNWKENEEDIEIMYQIPISIKNKISNYKDIIIKFHSKSIIISNKHTKEILINIKLIHTIDVDDSIWNVNSDDKCVIDITLTKAEAGMWNQLVE